MHEAAGAEYQEDSARISAFKAADVAVVDLRLRSVRPWHPRLSASTCVEKWCSPRSRAFASASWAAVMTYLRMILAVALSFGFAPAKTDSLHSDNLMQRNCWSQSRTPVVPE